MSLFLLTHSNQCLLLAGFEFICEVDMSVY